MPSVILDHVSQQVDGVTVVDDLSLEVCAGELLVLTGPTGSGMTAILRMIAGLDLPSRGQITIGAADMATVPPEERGVAIVSDINPRLTVFQNLASGLKLRRSPRAQVEKRVGETAAALGIEGLLALKPKDLTGGQRLRVAAGKALISSPEVILMNQPLASFCGPLKDKLRKELAQLLRRSPTTVIYATHDQSEAMALGDRIAVLRDGDLHQLDTPQMVYDQPADRFVASFVGSPPMNFVPALLAGEVGAYHLVLPAGTRIDIPASSESLLPYYLGREVVLGVRPEDFTDTAFAASDSRWRSIEAKVDAVEHLGAETMVYLSRDSLSLAARLHPASRLAVGETVALVVNMDKAHLFDKQTEKRIV